MKKIVDICSKQYNLLKEISHTTVGFKTKTYLFDTCYLHAACLFAMTLVP